MYSFDEVKNADPELAKAMEQETGRQNDHIELIASENFVSKAVMAAMGSTLTNKYAEGYPGKRYYGGCQYVDIVEDLARDRAKKLFGCTYANVQPHSGAQANMAVFFALVKPGETVMGMNLDHGGGSTPVPEARMDDGVLHTVLVKNISRMKFAGLFSAYSAGRYRSLPPEVVRVVTAKNVRIQSEDDIVTCLDGETDRKSVV